VDWRTWHKDYADPDSALGRRLPVVQAQVRAALDRSVPGSVQAISVCAGQGHDLLGVLAEHPRRAYVTARLVEPNEHNARLARQVLRIAWAANPEDAHGYRHDDALADLTSHIGKEVSVWLTMTDAEGRFWTVLPPLTGVLGKQALGTVEPGVSHEAVVSIKGTIDYAYTVGGEVLNLPPFPGTVSRYEQGIQ
jgi:hypothetical protein